MKNSMSRFFLSTSTPNTIPDNLVLCDSRVLDLRVFVYWVGPDLRARVRKYLILRAREQLSVFKILNFTQRQVYLTAQSPQMCRKNDGRLHRTARFFLRALVKKS